MQIKEYNLIGTHWVAIYPKNELAILLYIKYNKYGKLINHTISYIFRVKH